MSLKSYMGHRVRECLVHMQRIGQRGEKGRLIVLPNAPRSSGGSNLLWGWELSAELRRLGWRTTVLPPELDLCQRRRVIRMEAADAIFMIKGRHPLNRPDLYGQVPCIYVLDDADYLDPNQSDQVVACCRGSEAVIAGNEVVADWCRQHNDNVSVVWVSHPMPKRRALLPNAQRSPVVAWAHAASWFYPVEAEFIQRVILGLARRRSFEFWLYGVRSQEEGQKYLEPIRDAGVTVRTFSFMPSYQQYLKTLEEVAVGLHPVCLENPYSQGKSFGKILSYIAADVAVVTHNVLDHKKFFCHEKNGMLPNNVEEYVECVDQLLGDPIFRQRLVDNCYDDFVEQLSTPVAARKVDKLLSSVC